jgi:hypothetical protein
MGGGGDIAGDMGGIIGGGLGLAVGAVTIGAAGKIMLDAADQMSGKKKKKGKKKGGMKFPSINI